MNYISYNPYAKHSDMGQMIVDEIASIYPYIRVPGLTLQSIGLIPTEDFFWVGISKSSVPMNRRKTRTFTRCPVYFYGGKRVFLYSVTENMYAKDFYYVPDDELIHIQRMD